MAGTYSVEGVRLTLCVNENLADQPASLLPRPGTGDIQLIFNRAGTTRQDQPAGRNTQGDDERKKLVGTWRVESGERSGRPATGEDFEQLKKELTLVITRDKMTFKGGGADRDATYELGTQGAVKTIVFTSVADPDKGKVVRGVYAIDDDTLKLCVDDADQEPPTTLSTKPGTGQVLMVFVRQRAPGHE
jgi:uncharacterized protein (TIGR03067 family)